MNSYITLAFLLAVAASVQGSGIGLDYSGYAVSAPIIYNAPILASAVSTANVYKAAPIPIIKKVIAPILPAPIIKVPIASYGLDYDLGLGKGVDYLNLGIGLSKNLDYGLGYGYEKH